jgi:hypothetical protein
MHSALFIKGCVQGIAIFIGKKPALILRDHFRSMTVKHSDIKLILCLFLHLITS